MAVTMSERMVQSKIRQFAKEIWNLDCNLPVYFSARMTRALGYYIHRGRSGNKLVTPISFKFSKYLINGNYSEETIDSVIKHELCHWVVSLRTPFFSDGNREFENELRRVGAHSTGVIKTSGTLYVCKCSCCGKTVVKKRTEKQAKKYTDSKYTSRCCHARLVYSGQETIEDNNVTPIATDEQLRKTACTPIPQTSQIPQISNVLKIEDIIQPNGKRKINNQQMIPAIIAAAKENSQEKIALLRKTYPEVFESSFKYLPAKVKKQII